MLGESPEALFAHAQGRLGPMTFGDVDGDRKVADDGARPIAKGADDVAHPHDRTVRMQVLLLDGEGCAFCHSAPVKRFVERPVVRVGHRLHGAAEQIIARAAQDLAVAVIDEAHTVHRIDDDDTGFGLLGHGPKALLAFTQRLVRDAPFDQVCGLLVLRDDDCRGPGQGGGKFVIAGRGLTRLTEIHGEGADDPPSYGFYRERPDGTKAVLFGQPEPWLPEWVLPRVDGDDRLAGEDRQTAGKRVRPDLDAARGQGIGLGHAYDVLQPGAARIGQVEGGAKAAARLRAGRLYEDAQ